MARNIAELLGKDADYLLKHKSKTISKDQLHLPSSDFVDRIFINSNRSPQVLRNLQLMYGTGRLANTGFLPFCRSIRVSSTARVHRSPRTRFTLMPKTL